MQRKIHGLLCENGGGGAEEIGSGMDFSDYRVNEVISVPGAVVVSHGGGEGESGLVGLH